MQDKTIEDWLSELAGKQPAPGGGAAGALMAATSAALISMVAVYSTGEKWADIEAKMQNINIEASSLRAKALSLVEEDARAFTAVSAAYKLPRENETEKAFRQQRIHESSASATKPPRQIAELATRLVELVAELAENCNPNVISDVAVASSAARAALDSAIVNIEINQKYIDDPHVNEKLSAAIKSASIAIEEADRVTREVRKKLA